MTPEELDRLIAEKEANLLAMQGELLASQKEAKVSQLADSLAPQPTSFSLPPILHPSNMAMGAVRGVNNLMSVGGVVKDLASDAVGNLKNFPGDMLRTVKNAIPFGEYDFGPSFSERFPSTEESMRKFGETWRAAPEAERWKAGAVGTGSMALGLGAGILGAGPLLAGLATAAGAAGINKLLTPKSDDPLVNERNEQERAVNFYSDLTTGGLPAAATGATRLAAKATGAAKSLSINPKFLSNPQVQEAIQYGIDNGYISTPLASITASNIPDDVGNFLKKVMPGVFEQKDTLIAAQLGAGSSPAIQAKSARMRRYIGTLVDDADFINARSTDDFLAQVDLPDGTKTTFADAKAKTAYQGLLAELNQTDDAIVAGYNKMSPAQRAQIAPSRGEGILQPESIIEAKKKVEELARQASITPTLTGPESESMISTLNGVLQDIQNPTEFGGAGGFLNSTQRTLEHVRNINRYRKNLEEFSNTAMRASKAGEALNNEATLRTLQILEDGLLDGLESQITAANPLRIAAGLPELDPSIVRRTNDQYSAWKLLEDVAQQSKENAMGMVVPKPFGSSVDASPQTGIQEKSYQMGASLSWPQAIARFFKRNPERIPPAQRNMQFAVNQPRTAMDSIRAIAGSKDFPEIPDYTRFYDRIPEGSKIAPGMALGSQVANFQNQQLENPMVRRMMAERMSSPEYIVQDYMTRFGGLPREVNEYKDNPQAFEVLKQGLGLLVIQGGADPKAAQAIQQQVDQAFRNGSLKQQERILEAALRQAPMLFQDPPGGFNSYLNGFVTDPVEQGDLLELKMRAHESDPTKRAREVGAALNGGRFTPEPETPQVLPPDTQLRPDVLGQSQPVRPKGNENTQRALSALEESLANSSFL